MTWEKYSWEKTLLSHYSPMILRLIYNLGNHPSNLLHYIFDTLMYKKGRDDQVLWLPAADMNEDGVLNVFDIVQIVDFILN